MKATEPRPESPLSVRASLHRGDFTLDAEFEARSNKVVGLLGPNGAGKSTLLRTIAGLAQLDAGRISLGDSTFDDPANGIFLVPERRPVGVVFQNYRLFPHLSVLDNVAFGLRARGVHRAAARLASRERLASLGVADLVNRKPANLSGGEAQRVALARALVYDPSVLLLDEPLSALDARTRTTVRGTLRDQLQSFGGPVVVVTHDALEAMMLTDHLVVLENGRVTQQGPTTQVARRPVTPYVAHLVGVNLYRGHEISPGDVQLDGGGTLTVSAHSAQGSTARRVFLAVRPAAIAVHTQFPEGSSARNIWPAELRTLELLTDRVRLALAGTPDAIADVTPAAVASLGLAPGQRVWLSAKATDIDIYPDTSGAHRAVG